MIYVLGQCMYLTEILIMTHHDSSSPYHLPKITSTKYPNLNSSSPVTISLVKQPEGSDSPKPVVRNAQTCLSMVSWCLPGERLRAFCLVNIFPPDSESYRLLFFFKLPNSRGAAVFFSNCIFQKINQHQNSFDFLLGQAS